METLGTELCQPDTVK